MCLCLMCLSYPMLFPYSEAAGGDRNHFINQNVYDKMAFFLAFAVTR